MYRVFEETNISAIKPKGWLKNYLENQRNGLTGHLEVAGYPFDSPQSSWAPPEDMSHNEDNWCPYEQKGYWLDGMIKCAHLISDKDLVEKASQKFYQVINQSDTDGYLGPQFLKTEDKFPRFARWSHVVFFRALIAHYMATGDEVIVKALEGHYVNGLYDYSKGREVCNIEIMLWVYGKTRNEKLLQMAKKTYRDFNNNNIDSVNKHCTIDYMLSNKIPFEHGVTYNEICKLAVIMYIYTGKEKYLEAGLNAFRKIDKYSMLADGVPSSTEFLRCKKPLDSHETCDIADYTWSMGYLLFATGEAEFADKIEKACFNAAPGAVTSDFKALQYFSCPNQVIADKSSNHNQFKKGGKWMSYRPNPGTECCPGEVNRIMPNYISRMWLKDADGNITAALYGPSVFEDVINGVNVRIEQKTNYPFEDKINLKINTDNPIEFGLILRIPHWCKNAKVKINGTKLDMACNSGTFIKLDRIFNNNDKITLILPMELKLIPWEDEGVVIERGPLVYSLKINERWERDLDDKRCTNEFPAWNLYPESSWNYALDINEDNINDLADVKINPIKDNPWDNDSPPIEILVPARKIKGWELEHKTEIQTTHYQGFVELSNKMIFEKEEGDYYFTPNLPSSEYVKNNIEEKVEMVSLIPYGCTNLRMTIFPVLPR